MCIRDSSDPVPWARGGCLDCVGHVSLSVDLGPVCYFKAGEIVLETFDALRQSSHECFRLGVTLTALFVELARVGAALADADTFCSADCKSCLLYTSPSPRDRTRYRMPSSA
eukprot:TRINITY_DN30767_c0_g1_i1.p1 TRINITY_DN30767_c0_g1~~TRINITY_DN30767_c0_g1_i1.p1  ORF type:complete len:112 (-),score=35.07 TRINITY_DN30767_c0_g1_i1:19-354(-)